MPRLKTLSLNKNLTKEPDLQQGINRLKNLQNRVVQWTLLN